MYEYKNYRMRSALSICSRYRWYRYHYASSVCTAWLDAFMWLFFNEHFLNFKFDKFEQFGLSVPLFLLYLIVLISEIFNSFLMSFFFTYLYFFLPNMKNIIAHSDLLLTSSEVKITIKLNSPHTKNSELWMKSSLA